MSQVRLVLSLFPARPSPSGVAEEVGLPCALRKVVPASFRLAMAWLMLAPFHPLAARAQSVGASMRFAAPGAWSICGGASLAPGPIKESETRWKGTFRWGSSGFGGMGLIHLLRVDGESRIGVGCTWYRGAGGLVHTGVHRTIRWGIHWPLVQPAARPYRPNVWWTWTMDAGQGAVIGIRLDGLPGALPEIAATISRGRWQFVLGSRGGFAALRLGHPHSTSIHCLLGVARGDIPWCGMDIGTLTGSSALPSGPQHTTEFPW